jgi:tetratricopeptide (TPR) repeat protein
LLRQRRLPEALSAAKRAVGVLPPGSEADPDVRRAAEARLADLELLTRFEDVTQDWIASKDSTFNHARQDEIYGQLFRESGLDIDALPVAEAGERIRGRTAPVELAAALDAWSYSRRLLAPGEGDRWQHLLRVARAADPDGWRTRLREALERKDSAALAELASQDEAAHQLPPTLGAMFIAPVVNGNTNLAVTLLRKAQRQHPDDYWINDNLSLRLGRLGTSGKEEAIAFARVAVALRPQGAWAHNRLGNALADKGDVDGAIAEYQEAIRISKDFPHAHYNLGLTLRNKGDVDGAIAEFKEAIRSNKNFAHFALGEALLDKGDMDGAIAEFKEVIRVNKNLPEPHANLGSALRIKGDVDGAIAELREAIRLNNDLAPAHNNLGLALADKGDLDGAIAAYKEALRLKKDYAEPHNNLGVILIYKGDVDGAIAEFKEAIRLKKDWAVAHYDLGAALENKGDVDGAIAELREALRLTKDVKSPFYAAELAMLGRNLLQQKKCPEAEKVLRECLAIRAKTALEVWTTFNAQSILGEALAGQQKYAEAEPLLLAGYRGMTESAAPIPQSFRTVRLMEALERLVQLYDALGQKDKADQWRTTLQAERARKDR